MPGFRLKMATHLGEKTAAEAGFDRFPIDPHRIAAAKGIEVVAKPPEVRGISGALIFSGNHVCLIYSTEYANPGFEHFCIGHELGHFCIDGHPQEIMRQGGTHYSRANFTQNTSIELEADHFASGLLMPAALTRDFLSKSQIGLEGVLTLADAAGCSRTAAAIRAAECSAYPLAIVMSCGDEVAYAFLSESFKALGKLAFLRKGSALPSSLTRQFNQSNENVLGAKRACGQTTLADWFDCPGQVRLDEEIVGLGAYGYTLTVLSGEDLPIEDSDDEDDEADLQARWTPRFAYGR